MGLVGRGKQIGSTKHAAGVASAPGSVGVAVHGANASFARPTGHSQYIWIGSVQPNNAVNNDLWVNTA